MNTTTVTTTIRERWVGLTNKDKANIGFGISFVPALILTRKLVAEKGLRGSFGFRNNFVYMKSNPVVTAFYLGGWAFATYFTVKDIIEQVRDHNALVRFLDEDLVLPELDLLASATATLTDVDAKTLESLRALGFTDEDIAKVREVAEAFSSDYELVMPGDFKEVTDSTDPKYCVEEHQFSDGPFMLREDGSCPFRLEHTPEWLKEEQGSADPNTAAVHELPLRDRVFGNDAG